MSALRSPRRLRRGLARRFRGALRRGGRPDPGWTMRLTLAAIASYLVAELAFPDTRPLLAPLTALLVVQLTPVSLLTSGLDRVLAVVAGVGLAVLLSSVMGLTWWSLGLAIGVSLVVGQILRLGDNLLEVPISAMLVLGAAAADSAAEQRIAETLVGALVGVLSNLLFPPRVVYADAAKAIGRLADDVAALLRDAGRQLGETDEHWLTDWVGESLGRARRVTHETPGVGAVLLRAEESRRLNLRALGRPDPGPGLRHGLEALEHSAVAVRAMFANLEAVLLRRRAQEQQVDPSLRPAFAVILDEMAEGVRCFGRLVVTEALDPLDPSGVDTARDALDALHEARARIIDFRLTAARDDLVLGEIVVAIGGAVERLLREFDLDARRGRLASVPVRPRRPLAPLAQLPQIPRRPWR